MKLNRKGFTLIELLAVITILGILMIVGIPAVQRTINNSRKDTFVDTAKEYANAVKTAWAADDIKCKVGDATDYTSVSSSLGTGEYFVYFASGAAAGNFSALSESAAQTNKDALLQSGGKSSWGNADVGGYVKVKVEGSKNPVYTVQMVDLKGHGFENEMNSDTVERSDVKENITFAMGTASEGAVTGTCKVTSD